MSRFLSRVRRVRQLAQLGIRLGSELADIEARHPGALHRMLRQLAEGAAGLGAPRSAVYLGDHTVLTRLLEGQKIFTDTRDLSLAPHIMLDGYWEMWVTRALRPRVRPGMCVVDIGANAGYYTLLAAHWVGPHGRVFAFEPSPRLAELLWRSIRVNGFEGWTNIEEMALSDQPGEVELVTPGAFLGGASIAERFSEGLEPGVEQTKTTVSTMRLDDAIPAPQTVDVMKIDAEGAEPRILAGAAALLERSRCLTILLEFAPEHFTPTDPDPGDYLAGFQKQGFELGYVEADGEVRPSDLRELVVLGSDRGHVDLLLSRER